MRMSTYLALVAITIAAATYATVTPGCSAQQVGEAKQAAAALPTIIDSLTAEIDGLEADLAELKRSDDPDAAKAAEQVSAYIAARRADIDAATTALTAAAQKVANADSGWDIAEVGLGAAAGFFPPLLAAVPIIRRLRSAFETTVAAVAAGGGVARPDAAKAVMAQSPAAKALLDAVRVRIGDKVVEQTPAGG